MSKLMLIIGALLGTAEETIPIFIHNPESQKIEGVIVTEGNQLFETLATILAKPAASTAGTAAASTAGTASA
jgi:hypothetical protein